MYGRERLVWGAALAVRVAWLANRVFLLAVAAGLAATWVFPAWFAVVLIDAHAPGAMSGIRLLMVIGIVMAVATDRLLVALAQIIATARAGDPFIAPTRAVCERLAGLCLCCNCSIFPVRCWPDSSRTSARRRRAGLFRSAAGSRC
jgi:hypothetical protein